MAAIQDILKKFGEDTVSIIRTNLAATDTNAGGETSKSLESVQADNRVTVSGRPFIYAVETGRGPTRRGNQGGPTLQKQILDWIKTGKPGISENIEGASWAISKFIHKNGTKLFREGGRKDIITPAISNERVDALVEDLAEVEFKYVGEQIDNILINR